jgi:AcrR family transcriptional regulator
MTETPTAARVARTGLRERKKLATRQALSQAALRLAVERGLDNLLIEDIAAEVDVSPRTFNNYFRSKFEAICALGVDRAEQLGTALRARPVSEPLWEAITEAVLEHYDVADNLPDREWIAAVRLVMTAPVLQGEHLKMNATMQRVLADAIAERAGIDGERDMLPMIIAGAVTAASQVAVERWFTAASSTPLQPLLRQALNQLASACSPPTGA